MSRPTPEDFSLRRLVTSVQNAIANVLGDAPELAVGWPAQLERGARPERIGPGVSVRVATRDAVWLLWLDASIALRIVERVLGAPEHGGGQHAALTLSDEEQGVLAYVAAKCCAALGELHVVSVSSEWPAPLADAFALWGTVRLDAVHGGFLLRPLEGRAALDPQRYEVTLRVLLRDHLSEAESSALEVDDLICAEHGWPRPRLGGLVGDVVLVVDELDGCYRARLDGTTLRLDGPGRAPVDAHCVSIELAAFSVDFAQLVALRDGKRITVPTLTGEVILVLPEGPRRGTLVCHDDALAVRVDS